MLRTRKKVEGGREGRMLRFYDVCKDKEKKKYIVSVKVLNRMSEI